MPSVHGQGAHVAGLRAVHGDGLDLCRQLTRGRDDESLDAPRVGLDAAIAGGLVVPHAGGLGVAHGGGPGVTVAVTSGAGDALHDGQHEGGRLAGAGLRTADDVVTGEHHGNSTLLNAGGLVVAHSSDGLEQVRREAKLGERRRLRSSFDLLGVIGLKILA